MNYLSVEQLTKTYGDRTIFENLSFGIDQGQKVALVAKNGSGKSTLLRCLIGEEHYDDGRVVFRNDINIAYLEQSDKLNPENTIYEEVFDHDLPKLNVFKKYSKAVRDNDEEGMASLFEAVSELNAWDLDSLVEQILSKLKLHNYDAKVSTLSGGQRKRVALAKVLIAEPDFLFLDEPTNHLDLDMIEWLEEYLSKSNATIFMVTHDRYFLEVITDEIYELEDEQLYRYKGNFSYYLEKKAEREENLAVEVGKARSQFKKELQWIRRQPKARGTKQKARIDAFGDIKKKAHTNIDKEELEIPVKMERLGTKILELHNISKSYPNLRILDKLSYTFKRKERLGIVGPNGVGKSTLLRIITGEEEPDAGKVVIGDTVVFGYYSQANIEVDENKKVIDVIREVAEFIPLEKGREMSAAQFLEKFLFPRSMHYNYVYKLSGGERRRLKLMKVLMSNPNFLILDEPTNDLDIYILSVLEDYLKHFQGCLIIVSHDRYFMDKMVDHIFVFEGDAQIKDITGNYTAFREQSKKDLLEEQAEKRQEKADAAKESAKKAEEKPKVKATKKPAEKKKLSFKEKQEFEALDAEVEALETEKENLTAILSSGEATSDELNESSKRLGELMQELEAKTERWMELAEFA
ncbi:ABC-F family ATP-binding cassette domain-containing protein [Brumimicrobium aurantiacum]|uniref:ATP-binding cassette domain-containing protein n=1 Tax=Brumimicrobium aurantiacum TaxID=1737063 RepID=A0A3E1EZ61_9FLAO|nr:ABC-F family ATP-binding cassette domain-containing protein [Brumimicrobium aurantiacum]RFC54747.1 ATP-binding cassette domain-containing protein [Brumimicrobium aurantiacum]